MAWLETIFKVVGAIKQVFDWLFGDDGVTEEELKQALAEAVDEIATRTFLIASILTERHEYQLARDKVEVLAHHLQEYSNNPEEWRLYFSTDAAIKAWNSCNNSLDLIDNGGTRGIGLLGHPMFLMAAGLRLSVLQEWVRFYTDNGPSDKVEGARVNLRNALQEGIDIALGMEDEWIDWTELRFSPLSKRVKDFWIPQPTSPSYGGGMGMSGSGGGMGMGGPGYFEQVLERIEFKWVYKFNNEEQVASKLTWRPGDNLDRIQQGALYALAVWQLHREQERERVREAFVNPSKQVRTIWAGELFALGPKIGEMAEAYATFEQARDAAGRVQTLLAESFWKTHPEIRADYVEPKPAAKPSLITIRNLAHKPNRRIEPK